MSLAIIYSRGAAGIQAPLVTAEAHLSNGLPSFSIVGLPETAVKESKDRVRSALLNSHFEFPTRRITVNLAPADLPKEGGRFDLPIALGILAASGQIPFNTLNQYEFAGELALTGELRPIKGILPFAIAAKETKRHLIIPEENAAEAALVKDIVILPAKKLLDVCAHLLGHTPLTPYAAMTTTEKILTYPDLADVRGQHYARRALEIAAAGNHSLLLFGPPGTGKTMLATRLPSILPQMTNDEALEVAAIASINHRKFPLSSWSKRPFRSPHHSASSIALVGGGNPPRPGEVSMAHHGILFLDELPEFSRQTLEALREPLESGSITISRAARQAEFPAKFQLIAAMNPCPCGYLGHPKKNCRCTTEQIQRYRHKLSGPFLDRIDMQIEVSALPSEVLMQTGDPMEDSNTVRARVEKAHQKQLQRAGKSNAKLTLKDIEQFCKLTPSLTTLLQKITDKFSLSARAHHRILKLARTLADLDDVDVLAEKHLTEALHYRKFDREAG